MSELKIASNFSLPLSYITKSGAIIAKRRIGKTYNASVIGEEFVAAGLPFVVLDPTSAWWGMRASADGLGDGLPVTIIGGEHGDLPLDVGSGKLIADLVVEEPGFYICDLGHWESDSEHRRWAAPFLERVYRRKSKIRDPLHLFVDEADVFAPQKPQKGDELMLHHMEAIVRRGGIRGLGTTLITQRGAVLNKNVLTQLDILIILRTIAPQDQDVIDDYIKRGAAGQREEIMASLASLDPGEAWIYGPGEDPPIVERVQFRERRTFNSSATPDGQERIEPRQMAPVDLERARTRLADAIERQKENDPEELHKRIKALERNLKDAHDALGRAELDAASREAETVTETIEVPVIADGELERMEEALRDLRICATEIAGTEAELAGAIEMGRAMRAGEDQFVRPVPAQRLPTAPVTSPELPSVPRRQAEMERLETPSGNGVVDVSKGALEMLEIYAAFAPKPVSVAKLGVLLAKSSNSGPFRRAIRELSEAGHVQADALSPGRSFAKSGMPTTPGIPSAEEVQQRWRNRLKGDNALMQQVFEVVLAAAPDPITPEEIDNQIGKSPNSGPVRKAFKQLDSLQVCVYDRSNGGSVVASPYLLDPRAL